MIVCSINLKLCNTFILVASIHWLKKIITIVYVRQRGITLVIQCTTQTDEIDFYNSYRKLASSA